LSQKETLIYGLGKVRGLKRAVSGSLKFENVSTNWGTFDAKVSASQHQLWKSFRVSMKTARAAEKPLASTFGQHVYPRIAMDLSVFGGSENAKIVKTEWRWTARDTL
jgi:hypothetical protein